MSTKTYPYHRITIRTVKSGETLLTFSMRVDARDIDFDELVERICHALGAKVRGELHERIKELQTRTHREEVSRDVRIAHRVKALVSKRIYTPSHPKKVGKKRRALRYEAI